MEHPMRPSPARLCLAVAFAAALGLLALPSAAAVIVPGSPTSSWTPIAYPTLLPDHSDDQQTGIPEADIVGNLTNPAFYTAFDDANTLSLTDGNLAFRVRIGADKNPAGFSQFMGVGIDADLNGSLDIFLAVENSGNPDRVAIYDAGAGANTSPSTTTIDSSYLFTYALSASNYDFRAVTLTIDPTATSFDIDGDGDTDFFLSWVIPFADVVAALAGQPSPIVINQNSTLRYVVGSSTQPNALNQDLGGPNGGTNSTLSWDAIGAFSNPLSAGGSPILTPEPDSLSLLALGLLVLAAWRRRKAVRFGDASGRPL